MREVLFGFDIRKVLLTVLPIALLLVGVPYVGNLILDWLELRLVIEYQQNQPEQH
ncbi:hypothetical protein ACQ4M4_25500 [Leptolyngbya sp. AN02str]|uniref:hypothetical protein n=1 Tax=Leptolyngbya sp. AN02str TaxID=3423363 RepID=UPI003D3245C9